jgi:glycosyltransferase involved in cell wall biosynthesis
MVLGRRSLFDLAALRRFHRFCREREIDVIHTHDAASQFNTALTRFSLLRTPLLMTFHRSLGMESATVAAKLRNAFAGCLSAAIVTGSDERRIHFVTENYVSERKVFRIPFGTDLSRFHPATQSRKAIREELGFGPEVMLLGAFGHFGPEKGIDIAIEAFRLLANRPCPSPVALVVFGDGARRPEIEELARSVGSPGVVCLAGFRPDVERCMAAMDIMLHAPRLEAFGLVVIEAMASGLPVVASRVGGIPDLVRHGRTGFLATPGDPESLAGALWQLVSDRDLIAKMGAEARSVAVAEYSRELCARRHLDLYESLLR